MIGGDPTAVAKACSASGSVKLTNRRGDSVGSDFISFDGREPKAGTAQTSSREAVGDAQSKYSNIAEAGRYLVTVNLKQDASCTGKVPISDLEYPIRVMANVAPFVAKTTATPTPSSTPRATGAEEPPSSSGTSPWLWVALGVVLLGAALVALLVVLIRRNRASGPPPATPQF